MARPAWVTSVRRRPAGAVCLALLSSLAVLISVLTPMLLRAVQQQGLAEATAEGRWSVVGTDGSLQLPQALRSDWADGSLVTVEQVAPGELRVRRVESGDGAPGRGAAGDGAARD